MRIASNSAFRCLLVAQFILAQLAVQGLSAPTAKTATPEDLAREVARRMDLLQAVGKETPRESFDPAAVLAKLGDKPSAAEIFAFVRNRTHFVPYRGSLRGSRGVLMDRTGNSLDRALLLAELLRRSGRKVRLATATLSVPQAKGVLEAAGRLPKDLATPKMTTARQRTKATVLRLAAKFGLDAAAIKKDLQAGEDTISQAAKHAAERIEKQTKTLAAMLQADVNAKATRAKAVEDAREHWWVQVHADNAWSDLDPSSATGKQIAKPQQTVDIKPGAPADDSLDKKHHHRLNVRVVIEQWTGGKYVEHRPLTCTMRPSAVIDQAIVLMQVPTKWPKGAKGPEYGGPLAAIKDTFMKQDEWLPELIVGEKSFIELGFNGDGHPVAAKKKTSPLDIFGKKITEKLDPLPEGHLTAQWIEYEILAPGQTARKIRREVFDLVGPSARAARKTGAAPEPKITDADRLERALALTDRINILPTVGRLSPEFIEHLLISSLLANRKVFEKLAKSPDSPPSQQLRPMPAGLYALAAIRTDWAPDRGDVYLSAVNLLTSHTRIKPSNKNRVAISRNFDIVTNDVSVVPRGGVDPFAIRLKQGIVDTNAEAALVHPCSQLSNTAELFALKAPKGVKWVTLRSKDDLARVDLPVDSLARISDDLAAGNVVIAPDKAYKVGGKSRVAWWRVDPKAGTILGMGARGWGSAEYLMAHRARGEGIIEYIIILGLIMICSVVGFIDWVFTGLFGENNWFSELNRKSRICIDCKDR